jgi:hypothetical protein
MAQRALAFDRLPRRADAQWRGLFGRAFGPEDRGIEPVGGFARTDRKPGFERYPAGGDDRLRLDVVKVAAARLPPG